MVCCLSREMGRHILSQKLKNRLWVDCSSAKIYSYVQTGIGNWMYVDNVSAFHTPRNPENRKVYPIQQKEYSVTNLDC